MKSGPFAELLQTQENAIVLWPNLSLHSRPTAPSDYRLPSKSTLKCHRLSESPKRRPRELNEGARRYRSNSICRTRLDRLLCSTYPREQFAEQVHKKADSLERDLLTQEGNSPRLSYENYTCATIIELLTYDHVPHFNIRFAPSPILTPDRGTGSRRLPRGSRRGRRSSRSSRPRRRRRRVW